MNIFPFHSKNSFLQGPKRLLSKPSRRLLCYGLYAVLCQLMLILLHVIVHNANVSGALLALRFAPMLEHSTMSLSILACGVYLIERTVLEGER